MSFRCSPVVLLLLAATGPAIAADPPPPATPAADHRLVLLRAVHPRTAYRGEVPERLQVAAQVELFPEAAVGRALGGTQVTGVTDALLAGTVSGQGGVRGLVLSNLPAMGAAGGTMAGPGLSIQGATRGAGGAGGVTQGLGGFLSQAIGSAVRAGGGP